MRTVLLALVLLVAVVSGATLDFSFSGNVSISKTTDDVVYRRTTLVALGAGDWYTGAYYKSVSVGRTNNSAVGDAIWGAVWIGNKDVPFSWLAYWDSQATWGVGSSFVSMNVSSAAAYIANAYLALEERAPNGTLVQFQYLANAQSLNGFQWSLGTVASPSATNPQVSYVTFNGAPASGSWSISLTYVVSNVVGVLSGSGAIVSPKSVETIVSISNWPYVSSSNNLVLILATITENASGSSNGQYVYQAGSGTTSAYYSVGETATVNGNTVSVSSSGFYTYDNGYLSYVQDSSAYAQAQGRYGGQSAVQFVNVSFPAGASQITYDPTSGSGSPVTGSTTGAGSVVSVAWAVVLFSVFLALF